MKSYKVKYRFDLKFFVKWNDADLIDVKTTDKYYITVLAHFSNFYWII